MQSDRKRILHSAFIVCSFVLTIILAACGGSSSPPSSTPTAVPTATQSSSSGFQTFTGQGFTVDYPAGWMASKSGNNVTFTDPTKVYTFFVQLTPDPSGLASPSTVVDTAVTAAKVGLNNTKDESAPSPVTVGGESWVQKSFSGSASQSGQSVTVQFYVLADNHPANSPSTNSFAIVYGTAQSLMQTAQTTYFQHMLQSFKFTS